MRPFARKKDLFFSFFYWVFICPLAVLVLSELALQGLSLARPLFSDRPSGDHWTQTGTIRVLAIGDSNTYGTYLKLDDSYPKQLERYWNERHENKMEVINAGYPGTNSAGIIKNLEAMQNAFRPDITLLMIGTNDFWTEPEADVQRQLSSNYVAGWIKTYSRLWKLYLLFTRHPFKEEDLASFERVNTETTPFEKLSEDEIKKLTKNLGEKNFTPGTDSYESRHIEYQGKSFDFSNKLRKPGGALDPRDTLETNLIAIAKYADASGKSIVFLSYAGNKFFYKAANRTILRALSKYPFPFVDITTTFNELCPEKHICPDYLFPDQHATAAGNKIVSKLIGDYLDGYIGNTKNGKKE